MTTTPVGSVTGHRAYLGRAVEAVAEARGDPADPADPDPGIWMLSAS